MPTTGSLLWRHDANLSDPFFIFMGSLPVLVGVLFLVISKDFIRSAREKPFRIYQNGFTQPRVPFLTALRGKEVLIPASRVTKVRFRTVGEGKDANRAIIVQYQDEKGKEGTVTDNGWYGHDQLELISAFDRMCPGRVDAELLKYLDPGLELEYVEDDKDKPDEGEDLGLFFIALLGFPGMLFGFSLAAIVEIEREYINATLGQSLMFLGAGLFSVWAFVWIIDEVYVSYWAHNFVKGTQSGIHVPRRSSIWFFLRTKDVVPYSDIRRVCKKVIPGQEAHYYEALATGDRVFKINHKLYDIIITREEFEPLGFEHVNSSPVPPGEPPLVSTRKGLYGLYILMATMVWTVGLLFLFGLTEYVEAIPMAIAPVCISVLGAILIVMLFVTILPNARTSRRIKAMKGRDLEFHVDPVGMRIPRAPSTFREVSRYDVESVTVRKFSRMGSTKYLDLRTSKGRLDLPISLANDIRCAGFVVEDPEGHLMDVGDESKEPKPMRWPWRGKAE